jgi:hypothetical protein
MLSAETHWRGSEHAPQKFRNCCGCQTGKMSVWSIFNHFLTRRLRRFLPLVRRRTGLTQIVCQPSAYDLAMPAERIASAFTGDRGV